MSSSYTYEAFKPFIKSIKPKIVAEVGSMHGLDTIELMKEYNPEKVIVVECNPEGIELCKKNLKPYKQVTLVENAAWNTETTLSFYKVVESRDMNGNVSHSNEMHKCNIGASSCFKTNNVWPFEYYRQEEIKVKARRLEDIFKDNNIDNVDLICMDVQIKSTLSILLSLKMSSSLRALTFISSCL